MKNKILLTIAITFLAITGFSQTNGQIHLAWNYPTNELSYGSDYPVSFRIRSTNTLTINPSNWPIVIDSVWTNFTIIGTNNDGTYTFKAPFLVQPVGQCYFVATANGFWGESVYSNTSSTPSVAIPLQTQVFKN